MPTVAYVMDVSSVSGGRFAWARRALKPAEDEVFCGGDFSRLVSKIREDLTSNNGCVALGLEAPLYMLAPKEIYDVNEKRKADNGERAVISGPSATSALTGLQQLLVLLEALKTATVKVSLDMKGFMNNEPGLYLFEVFVGKASTAKDKDQIYMDSVTALSAFAGLHHSGKVEISEADRETQVLSLAGAALAFHGLADASALKTQPYVVRPESPADAIGGHPARLAYEGRNAGFLILSSELLQPKESKKR
jgi:hypothetical protein